MTPLERVARFERDLVVQAGAGTGKTHALVTLYLHLVGGLTAARRRCLPSTIAVVTFTDKAAGELKERLRTRLAALAADPRTRSEPTLAAVARSLGAPLPDAAVWSAALAQLGAAPVGTFHSFAGALLRRHAARAAIDPDFVLYDEREAGALAVEAAERAILDALEHGASDVAELTAEYGYHGTGVAAGLVELVVALRGARAEEGRGAAGLADGYAPARLAADWQAAADALRAAFASLPALFPELRDKSLDRARDVAARAAALVLSPGCAAEVWPLVDELRWLRGASGLITPVRDAARRAWEQLVDAETAHRAAPLAVALTQLVAAGEDGYRARKREAAALDFTDSLVRARDLLRDDAEVRAATQARFAAVLVDEFQDTNPVQAELVELVGGPVTADRPAARFVVGDRKQSIYEFRGADVAVFTEVTRELVARGAVEEVLRQSRRALPSLLRFNNALFARAMAPASNAAWALSFQPARDDLEPHRGEPARPADTGAELLTVSPDGGSAPARRREAQAVAARIAQLRAAGHPWGDIAILLRRFTALADYLDALRAAQIPHYVVRGRGLFAAQEVRDVASALALLDDPDDTFALVSVLRSPLVGLSDETLARLATARRLRAGSLLGAAPLEAPADGDALAIPADERTRLEAFRARFTTLRQLADRLGPAACVQAILDGADLRAVVATTREGEQRVANLERLCERARAFEADGGDLRGFIAWLRRATSAGAADAAQAQIVDERDDVVRVMTVHQAKGLEFPVVFVPGCGGKEPPDTAAVRYDRELGLGLRLHDPEQPGNRLHSTQSRAVADVRNARRRAESLRLFYVAATRARDLCVFSGEPVAHAAGTWRHHLDELRADETRRSLLNVVDESTLPPPTHRPEGVQFSLFADAAADRHLARAAAAPSPAPRHLTVAVTQLADFALCPRRYHYFHALGLAEHPAAARAASTETADGSATLDPLRRGTLAHRLLERVDFAAPDLDALLFDEGYDPAHPSVAAVREHVARFLATPFATGLAARAPRRELPFVLALPLGDGGRLLVRGQIDLVLIAADGVTVIDYKHARSGDPEDYRFQLDCYALAARRLYPRAPALHTGLVFLQDSDPTPRLQPAAPASELEARLSRLGAELARARARDAWSGQPVERCREIGCGYVYRCHAGAES